jgi:hypothetical protein
MTSSIWEETEERRGFGQTELQWKRLRKNMRLAKIQNLTTFTIQSPVKLGTISFTI